MNPVRKMKKRVTVSVESLYYTPVKSCCNLLGKDFSEIVNAFLGIVAFELRNCDVNSQDDCLQCLDKVLNRARGVRE